MTRQEITNHIDRRWPRLPLDLREYLIESWADGEDAHNQSLVRQFDYEGETAVADVQRRFMSRLKNGREKRKVYEPPKMRVIRCDRDNGSGAA